MSACVEAFALAREAQRDREEAYSLGYEPELRNYRTDAYGDGEAPLTLTGWLRMWGREEDRKADWEHRVREEARTLPARIMGSTSLEAAKDESDPLARALLLGGMLEDANTLMRAVAKVRADALRELRATGLSLAQIAAQVGMTRQNVHEQLKRSD